MLLLIFKIEVPDVIGRPLQHHHCSKLHNFTIPCFTAATTTAAEAEGTTTAALTTQGMLKHFDEEITWFYPEIL